MLRVLEFFVHGTGAAVNGINPDEIKRFERSHGMARAEAKNGVDILTKLAGTGAMTLSYSPARRRVGKRGARSAECIFWFSPEFIEAVLDYTE